MTVKKEEKSVLDFFVVCDLVLQFIVKMVVDEDKLYALSSYTTVRGKSHKKDSDHNTTYIELSVNIPKIRAERKEIFNFKNKECQEKFLDITNNTLKLSNCFYNDEPVREQGKRWFKNLNGLFQQTFKKVRITSVQKETSVSKLFNRRLSLKQQLKVANENEHEELQIELEEVEEDISKEVSKENRDKIVENFKHWLIQTAPLM